MKRHPALQDLSRDHFTALNHVVRVRRIVESDRFAEPLAAVHAPFKALIEGPLLDHFEEEESFLLPHLHESALAERLRDDHARLRDAGAVAAATPELETLWAFAQDLERHARWEETVLFQHLQDALSEAELDRLLADQVAFRRGRGMPVGPA